MEDALPSGLLEVCLLVGVPREQLRTQLQVRGAVVAGVPSRLGCLWGCSCQRGSPRFNSGLSEISSPLLPPGALLLSTDQQNC